MSQQINLFNPVFLKQPKYFSAATMAQALAAVFAGTLLIYAYTVYQNGVLEQAAKESEDILKQRREQLRTLGAQQSGSGGSKLLDEELARLEGRLQARKELLSGLTGGEDAVGEGFSLYLTAFSRQSMQGVWLTGFNVGGKGAPVVLNGRALRAELLPAYLSGLGSDEALRGRAVSELRLSAREEPAAAPEPAAKAGPAGSATATVVAPAGVMRFVEFTVTLATAQTGEASPQAAKPAAAAKGTP